MYRKSGGLLEHGYLEFPVVCNSKRTLQDLPFSHLLFDLCELPLFQTMFRLPWEFFRLQFHLLKVGMETLGTMIFSVTPKLHESEVQWLSKKYISCACIMMTRICRLFGPKNVVSYDGEFLTTSSFCLSVLNDNLRPEVSRIGDSSLWFGGPVKSHLIRYLFYTYHSNSLRLPSI